MKKAIFIVGPTAVGKTALAVKLHKTLNSVLVNADSIQVFKNLDIVSGKDHPKDTAVFLVDIIDPDMGFSVADYISQAALVVNDALAKGIVPIIVGGTGFYTQAFFENINTFNIPPDQKLRNRLGKKTLIELKSLLSKVSPERMNGMNHSDINNKRRLIRAIEVSGVKTQNIKPIFKRSEILLLGLEAPMDYIREKIKQRVQERIKMGALGEVKSLFKDYKNISTQIKNANGYKQIFEYLLNKMSWEEAIKKWEIADGQHAKKQMTWFRKDKDIIWFDVTKKGFEEKVFSLIKDREFNII